MYVWPMPLSWSSKGEFEDTFVKNPQSCVGQQANSKKRIYESDLPLIIHTYLLALR